MSDIKCKACGRRYNYRESDLCPHCGAYNKPTSRLRVDFNEEGSAELLHEQEFLRGVKPVKNERRPAMSARNAMRIRYVKKGGQCKTAA